MGALSRTTRFVLFGSGDFAFNLYWQSVGFYLLFFYTEVAALSPATAGAIFMTGALWGGAADLVAGAVAERTRASYRRLIGWGAAPLGLAFAAMFALPGAAWALAAGIAFRTAYAFTNVPYAAWTTRLAMRSDERASLAGLRMVFGAAAAALVAIALPALAAGPAGYPGAAGTLAVVGVPLLLLVVALVPEPVRNRPVADGVPLSAQLAALARNRAFVTLNLAVAAGGAASALLGQSVLYHFRYLLADEASGPRTLAAMSVAAVMIVPAWTLLATRIGARATWLVASLAAAASLIAMAVLGTGSAMAAGLCLVAAQAAFAGFNLAAWALLPDTVDWGELHDGVRVEALAFGAFSLVQKATLGGAGLAIGSVYAMAGFVAGPGQTETARAAIRWLMLAGPAALVALSIAAMLANPLRRDALDRLRSARTRPTRRSPGPMARPTAGTVPAPPSA